MTQDRRSPEGGHAQAPRGRSRPNGNGNNGGQRSEKHRATADSDTHEEQCHPRKVFIGGLAHKTTTQHLRDHFGRFGNIVDAVVLRWPDGRSRGFGYVTYADSAAAASVLTEGPHALSGREVDVKRAVPGTNKLFVGGLPQNTTANELREHFEQFGVVSDAVVMIDPATSRSRGFGFVCFLPGQEGAEAVQFSLQQYQNHRIRGKWIEVKSAAPPHKLVAKNGTGIAGAPKEGPSYEELCLAGALNRPSASPTPSVSGSSDRDTKEHKSSSLGSPRKVALPSGMDSGNHPLATPPGLNAPSDFTFKSEMSSQATPWFPSQPWPQPYYAGGYETLPPFAGFAPGPVLPNLGADYFSSFSKPQAPDESGLSVSFQRNLEVFLRQSVQDKLSGAPRDPSVSTTCSADAIHYDI